MATKRAQKTPARISKHDALLKLLHSNTGASIAQMQKTTGWQQHSIRGFLSGTVKRRLGLALKSAEGKNGERRYSITEH